ncbi:hypothetical protein E2C01_074469 [Portunus trituberculatus]|uniref:Uncharacterized protein n=1 Tax=Portunus trituberculatus TaxID=210409 RepID=A0A5B7I839_PORTR|nr:hypothetical protein [Portunus trituberculatus]
MSSFLQCALPHKTSPIQEFLLFITLVQRPRAKKNGKRKRWPGVPSAQQAILSDQTVSDSLQRASGWQDRLLLTPIICTAMAINIASWRLRPNIRSASKTSK